MYGRGSEVYTLPNLVEGAIVKNLKKDRYIVFSGKYLGSIEFQLQEFPEQMFKNLESANFKKLSVFDKHNIANQTLCEAIQQSEDQVFLLPKVVAFISRLRESLPTYHLGSFEFWLNHFSKLSEEEQEQVRAKIVGKWMPRSAFQKFFPLGMGGRYKGPHFSFAHYSPDLDTTVASFHCFLAAFACRIGSARHHWVVPGGPPKGSIEIDFLFLKALGEDVFKVLSKSDREVEISSLDLLTQENIEKRRLSDVYYDIDSARSKKAAILVDENGHYLGDWRQMDVDPVHSIISRFWRIMTEHQNAFHIGLISLFAKKELRPETLKNFVKEILVKKFADCVFSSEFTSVHRRSLDKFLKEVIEVKNGYSSSYEELITALGENFGFRELKEELVSLVKKPFFNSEGFVIDDREKIFGELEKVITAQKESYKKLLRKFDTLEIALKIKQKVLEYDPNYISHLSELEQIQKQVGDYTHLTVNYKEGEFLFPLGVVHAMDLNRKFLATASWNDFSNPTETDSRAEIEIISYIDHHKSEVRTNKPAMGIVMDAQSSNSIYANLLMEINDQYATAEMTLEQIEQAIQTVSQELQYPSQLRILSRLLKYKDAYLQNQKNPYYISKDREILEYMQCLFAILDDTDLLTKVSAYDVETMKDLINRLKSLMLAKVVEVVNFDDLEKNDPQFVKKAAKKLLQTQDLYSLYSIIYKAKEEAIEEMIYETIQGVDTPFFQDTKFLSGYASVGQFKHFIRNAATVEKKSSELRKIWTRHAKHHHRENPDSRLFIFMVSTISSAEELFADNVQNPTYQDELWIWCPEGCAVSEAHLKRFLSGFTQSAVMEHEDLEIHFYGKAEELERACETVLIRPYKVVRHKAESPSLVLKVPQKKVVSRKAQIAPYL